MTRDIVGVERLRNRSDFNGVHVELCRPADAHIKRADELVVGERLYYHRAYRTIASVQAWTPPLPEQAHDLSARIQHHTRLGEFDEVNRLARELAAVSGDLHRNRDDEIRVTFDSSRWPHNLRIRAGIPVAVQPKRSRKTEGPKLSEICERLQAHFDRIADDDDLNQFPDGHAARRLDVRPFASFAKARRAGSRCQLTLPRVGKLNLDRGDALEYLAWLDAGNVGHPRDARRIAERT